MRIEELKNQIICGDCLEVMKGIPDKSVDLLLTDIPYGGVNRESNGLRNLDKGKADIVEFDLLEMVNELIRITKGSGYIFCEWEQISPIIQYLRDNKISNRLCVWKKTNPSPTALYHRKAYTPQVRKYIRSLVFRQPQLRTI